MLFLTENTIFVLFTKSFSCGADGLITRTTFQLEKSKQISRPDSMLLAKLLNVTWNSTQMHFTFL